MLAAIIIWSYIFVVLYLYGSAAVEGVRRILNLNSSGTVDLPITLLLGLMLVTIAAMIGHLFIPLGMIFILALSAGALVIAFRLRRLISVSLPKDNIWIWVFLIFVFVTILENATHIPLNDDTGLYHVQTIRWFETYRIVPGLGNLQMRYAFNSSWLVLNSAFSFAFLGSRSFHLMNGVIFLSAMYYFVGGLRVLFNGQLSTSALLKIFFLPLSFYLLGSEISSLGNDMPVTLMIWLIFLLWLERNESPSDSHLRIAIIYLLCFFAVTVKLSSLPLLLFAIFILAEYLVKKDWRSVLILVAMGVLIFLPWMIRSVFLSGYLIFPQLQIDLFPVDWKMSKEAVEVASLGITWIARIGNVWRPSMQLSFLDWAPGWFDKLTINRQAIFLLALSSPLFVLFGRYKYPLIVSNKYILAFATAFTGSVFWFVAAPDVRFGYGFLIVTCLFALSPFVLAVIKGLDKQLKFIPIFTVLFLYVFQAYIFLNSLEPSTLSQRWLLPADYPASRGQPCGTEGAEIYCRKTGEKWTLCYYDLFPCIPSHFLEAEMRGTTFQEGFRSNVISESLIE